MRKYFYLILLLMSCAWNENEPKVNTKFPTVPITPSFSGMKEDTLAGIEVTIIQDFEDSSNTAPNVLVLPGWDFERHRWIIETSLRDEAKKHRFRLILPEMKRSIYATHFYPETSTQARKEKTGTWLTDTFILAFQKKYHWFLLSQRNFVMGLSTGGRGAVYCAWKRPDIFKAAASLSGDFDQTQTPNDFLVTEVYGKYSSFKSRWEKEDNLRSVADSIHQPLFLDHGDADKVVPVNQTLSFYSKIKSTNPRIKIKIVKGAGHDFKFWGGEVGEVLGFFDSISK